MLGSAFSAGASKYVADSVLAAGTDRSNLQELIAPTSRHYMSLADALAARKTGLRRVPHEEQHIVDPFSSAFDCIDCLGATRDGEVGQLFLGALGATQDADALASADIRTIVSVTEATIRRHPRIEYLGYSLPDSPEAQLMPHWPEICAAIDVGLQKGGVLVHCNMGVSRSGATVVAYVARRLGVPCDEALSRVRLCRSCVRPNAGFLQQLEIWAPRAGDVPGSRRSISSTGGLDGCFRALCVCCRACV